MNRTIAMRGLLAPAMAACLMACGSGVASGGGTGSGSGGAQSSQAPSPFTGTFTAPSTGAATSPPRTTQGPKASAVPAQLAATCSTGTRACPIRISFVAGAYAAQAQGELSGIASEQWFVVNARAGQTMVVVVAGAGATRGVVTFPNGQSNGQPGGRVFDGVLPLSGDYRIHVTESQMGEGWSGRVDVVVLIY